MEKITARSFTKLAKRPASLQDPTVARVTIYLVEIRFRVDVGFGFQSAVPFIFYKTFPTAPENIFCCNNALCARAHHVHRRRARYNTEFVFVTNGVLIQFNIFTSDDATLGPVCRDHELAPSPHWV